MSLYTTSSILISSYYLYLLSNVKQILDAHVGELFTCNVIFVSNFQWDKNRDGFISIGELKVLIAVNEDINLTKESIDMLLSRFDCNNDELLDFDEFLTMINNPTFKQTFQNITQK